VEHHPPHEHFVLHVEHFGLIDQEELTQAPNVQLRVRF
jgi:hypothetical protein